MGNDVAFGEAPDLHTAAHEAAHVVQQRGGVQLKGGVGKDGDHYEQHADAVADAVVAGRSAEGLLTQVASPAAAKAPTEAVQRRGPKKPKKKTKVSFDQATEVAQAVSKIASEQNVDGKTTPDTVGAVPGAFKAALWELYFARVGKIGQCTDAGTDLSNGSRLTAEQRIAYVASATQTLGPAMKVILKGTSLPWARNRSARSPPSPFPAARGTRISWRWRVALAQRPPPRAAWCWAATCPPARGGV
jgi:hypothetical protein